MIAHADVIGNLLRPPWLLEARQAFDAGDIPRSDFKAVEDRVVEEAVAPQEEDGLRVVTDGEVRRISFQSPMTEAVDVFGDHTLDAFLWGDWHGDGAVGGPQPTPLV